MCQHSELHATPDNMGNASGSASPAAEAPCPAVAPTAEVVGAQLVLLLQQEGLFARKDNDDSPPSDRPRPPNAMERKAHKMFFLRRRFGKVGPKPSAVAAREEPDAPSAALSPPKRESLERSTPFRGPKVPRITLAEYVRRLTSYSGITPEAVIMGFALLERLSAALRRLLPDAAAARTGADSRESPQILAGLCPYSVHRAVLVSMMLAHKMHDDKPLDNRCWAYLGGISLREINALEMHFLVMVGYGSLVVHPMAFNRARRLLSKATVRYIDSRKRALDEELRRPLNSRARRWHSLSILSTSTSGKAKVSTRQSDPNIGRKRWRRQDTPQEAGDEVATQAKAPPPRAASVELPLDRAADGDRRSTKRAPQTATKSQRPLQRQCSGTLPSQPQSIVVA
mmetsp:Transcript_537/g.1955  ORF Transcript_537/g.1955 Transcript_537/m.1955 type:complete len:398 (-) Transcript_537:555-1748(-)